MKIKLGKILTVGTLKVVSFKASANASSQLIKGDELSSYQTAIVKALTELDKSAEPSASDSTVKQQWLAFVYNAVVRTKKENITKISRVEGRMYVRLSNVGVEVESTKII